MNQQYLSEVVSRLDSYASLFIGSILLTCLFVSLLKGGDK